MPGFSTITGDESIVYADNVSFDGTDRGGKLTANGQMLIGSTISPKMRVGIPTGSNGIVVTPGPGTLDFSYTGSKVEQIVHSQTGALILCDTVIPFDDTIPQITEGDQVLTVTITPKHATDLLVIEFSAPYGNNLYNYSTFALFQDAIPDALAAVYSGYDSAAGLTYTENDMAILRYVMVAGTTSATTFQIRAGQNVGFAGHGVLINGDGYSSTRACGGVASTVLTVTEFNAGGAGTSLASLTSLTDDFGTAVHPDGALNINIKGGSGITTVSTPATNTLTISASPTGMSWNDVTTANYTLLVNEGFVTNRGAGVAYVLPATAAFGDKIEIVGKLGLAAISQNVLQQISYGAISTTIGVGGSLTATDVGDCLVLRCITAGASTLWRVESSIGNWSVV